MATLTSETTFDIIASPDVYEEEDDLYIYPNNPGTDALRELHYPDDLFPGLVYPDNPDRWTNFDSAPMTARPQTRTEQTLSWAQTMQWPGYVPDRPVTEHWIGSDNMSRMILEFLRRLYEYYANPPMTPGSFITWHPKDRTTTVYNIMIESVQVGGTDIATFLYSAHYNDLVALEVIFQFRIIGEVA